MRASVCPDLACTGRYFGISDTMRRSAAGIHYLDASKGVGKLRSKDSVMGW